MLLLTGLAISMGAFLGLFMRFSDIDNPRIKIPVTLLGIVIMCWGAHNSKKIPFTDQDQETTQAVERSPR